MRIKVTRERIVKGLENVRSPNCKDHGACCAVAISIQEETGIESLCVGDEFVFFEMPQGKVEVRLPYEASRFVNEFDSFYHKDNFADTHEPFSFELGVPCPSS